MAANITPTALYERMRAGEAIELIDVRSPQEYESVHAKGAICIPLEKVTQDSGLVDRLTQAGQPVYVICQSGGRSQAACNLLAARGLNTINVEGGTMAWERAGLPVERAAGAGPSNRLRVGGLALFAVGLVLGFLVHPYFFLGAAGVWFAMVLSGNAPCCAARSCPSREG